MAIVMQRLRTWRSNLLLLSRLATHPDSWCQIPPCDVLLVCGDNDRSYVFRGQKYAQLIDSVGDILRRSGISCATVARGVARLTGNLAYMTPASINRSHFRIVVGQRLRSFRSREAAMRWRIAEEAELWTKILSTCGAKAVIGIQPDSGLCRAANELGVPVFDLQHGIMDTVHNSYYKAERLRGMCMTDLPSAFLTWDMKTANALTSIAGALGIPVTVVGNPWFSRFAALDESDDLVKEAMDAWPHSGEDLPTILVTLQHGLGELAPDYVTNGVMADCLGDVIRQTSDSYSWKIRLHPSQLNGPESGLVEQYLREHFGNCRNVEWRICSQAPLPLLLARADLHITHFSATTMEAAWLGLRTVLLDPHMRIGAKHEHLLVEERARNLAHCLPLVPRLIEQFIETALKQGSRSGEVPEYSTESLYAFVADLKKVVAERTRPDLRLSV